MDTRTVLVVDGDPKNLQILRETLQNAGFKVTAVDDGIKAWETILTERPDVIVSELDLPGMDGFHLLAKLQKDPIASNIPLIFLTNRRNLDDRLKSLRSGVKDYMIKPLHVKEVVARINMILKRLEKTRVTEPESGRKLVGKLEEQSVEELVENCGIERRTGVLALFGQNDQTGEIFFREGAVVNARFGNFKAEKAVYQMLPWRQGHFVFTLKDVNVSDEITVSNLGLLLQGFKRLQERERLIKQLPSLDAVFEKTPIFDQILKKKTISSDAYKFVSLFDGKRTISDIIAESIYDDLKTLEKTVKLHTQGFIRPRDGYAKADTIKPAEPPPKKERVSVPEKPVSPEPKPEKLSQTPSDEEPILRPQQPTEAQTDPFETLANQADEEIHSNNNAFEKPKESEPGVSESEPEEIEEESSDDSEQPFDFPSYQDEEEDVNGAAKEHQYAAEPEDIEEEILSVPSRPVEKPREARQPSPLPKTIDSLFDILSSEIGRLVVIGSDVDYRKKLLSKLTNGKFADKIVGEASAESVEFGKVATWQDRTLEVIGISTHGSNLQLLDRFSETLVGYIVLVAGDDPPDLSYLGYLTNSLKRKLKKPHVVAVYRPEGRKPMPLDVLRYSMKMDEQEQLAEVDANSGVSISKLLEQLVPPQYPRASETETKPSHPTARTLQEERV